MPAIADITISKSPESVWSVIADPSSHPHWLSQDFVTEYDSELAEGMKFTRRSKQTGESMVGEVVAVRPARFLKVRVDFPDEAFAVTEYHLVPVAGGCALRAIYEVFDTGSARHAYFPDLAEQQLQAGLERLRSYCERPIPR